MYIIFVLFKKSLGELGAMSSDDIKSYAIKEADISNF